jgi:hypothetical protein
MKSSLVYDLLAFCSKNQYQIMRLARFARVARTVMGRAGRYRANERFALMA